MITRRRFLEHSALAPATLACRSLSLSAAEGSADSRAPVHLAIIGSTYHYGSELQTLADRFLVGYPHEGDWHMPNVQVVYVDDPRNSAPFASWQGGKLLVSPWLHGEGNCMNITYTILVSGQQQPAFGLVIPPLPAGQEPDSACVDRATTAFYQVLVVQGL